MNSAKTKQRPRPLSPHLQIYSWLITSTLSIMHRLTGVALSLGLVLVCAWLICLAFYIPGFEMINSFFSTIIGKVILGGWSFALYYHLCNGIRHLFWDMGKGFDLKTVTFTGVTVLLVAAGLTALTWARVLGVFV